MTRVRPGAIAFFALLAATLLTAVVVVRARTPDLVLEVTAGVPCAVDASSLDSPALFEFFVREDEPHARVAIVDSSERVVRTLDPDIALEASERTVFKWNYRDDEGERVRPGRYRLLVELPAEGREMVWPQRVSYLVPSDDPACPARPGES